jgi:hypothetical protein
MEIKKFNGRFVPKGDTEANWNKAVGFIPLDKEIIIYKPDEIHLAARFKVGDGKTVVQELPFSGADEIEIKTYIDSKIEAIPQADYNQNDPAAADYIKNRPFYEEETIITKELVNESVSEEYYEWFVDTSFSEKDIFDITFNGVEYSGLTCRMSENDFYIYGNLSIADMGGNTEEPFVFVCGPYREVSICAIMTAIDISGGVPITIVRHGVGTYIKQLDEKYLPDSIAKVEDLDRQQKEIDGTVIVAVFNITETNTEIALKNLEGRTEIDWGDGVIDNKLSHNYANAGDYRCKIYDVTSIGDNAFQNCDSLMRITIPNSVTSIGHEAFYDCKSLTSVVIPDSINFTGHSTFHGCSSLMSVVIPDSVTIIGGHAFSSCSNLTSIEIPDSVDLIGECAFAYCGKLTSVFISDSVRIINDGAFSSCISLTNVKFTNLAPINYYVNQSWFDGCTSLTHIYVPYGCRQAYIDKWTADGAPQDILDKIVESDREAMMSDVNTKVHIADAKNGLYTIYGKRKIAGVGEEFPQFEDGSEATFAGAYYPNNAESFNNGNRRIVMWGKKGTFSVDMAEDRGEEPEDKHVTNRKWVADNFRASYKPTTAYKSYVYRAFKKTSGSIIQDAIPAEVSADANSIMLRDGSGCAKISVPAEPADTSIVNVAYMKQYIKEHFAELMSEYLTENAVTADDIKAIFNKEA